MGIQTIGSQGDTTQQRSQLVGGRTSFYSLPLDEVETHIGKPLASMNLDELLKNVENAVYASASASSASLSDLQHMFSGNTSKKTVAQVWRDIQKAQQHREISFGEMTLEDFMVKAAEVVSHKHNAIIPVPTPHNITQQQNQLLQYQLPSIQQQQLQNPQHNMMGGFVPGHVVTQPVPVVTNPHLEVTNPENQISLSPPLIGNLSDPQKSGCKRDAIGDGTEKTTERKQKRMIKNRESAARSRAKKQAYTNELEIKVSLLEEENERLKKQQELKKMLQCAPLPEPKFQLRRTSSANF